MGGDDDRDPRDIAEEAVMTGVRDFIGCILDSSKPTVFFNRGPVLGMCWTIQGGADFVYCTPETTFQVPFMKSFQSPEGCSTF
jgi:enoyl-CoA hydratase/carnithine racemase